MEDLPKKRVLDAIAFKPPSAVPVWSAGFDDDFIPRWRSHLRLRDDAHPLTHYRNDTEELAPDERFFPSRAGWIGKDGSYDLVNDGWGCIVRTQPGTYFSEVVDRVLKSPADLDQLTFDPVTLPIRFISLQDDIERVRTRGLCGFAKMGGIYIRSQFLYGEENLLIDMASDEGFCDALFDKVASHLQAMVLETLARTNAHDCGVMVNDDMAGVTGPVFSPKMFERYLLPRYQKIIRACRAAGCRHVFFHSDGNISPLIDLIIECGFEGINPVEPRCNPSLIDLRRKYGNKLVLMGGVCNTQILRRNNAREIESHLRPLIELAKEGGVLLGTASIPAETPPEAYDLMMRLIEQSI